MTIFRKLILAALAVLGQVGGLATPAQAATTLLPNGKQCFTIAGGAAAVAGSINMYIPATTTIKNTWQDANQVTLNANPIQLDSQGCAIIYGVGAYRQQLFDGPVSGGLTSGNLIWDQLTTDTSAANVWISAGVAAGSGNAITVNAPGFSSVDGTVIQFIALNTNSGAATLTATGSGVGAISVVKDTALGPVSLTGGEITANDSITVVYDLAGNQFHIIGASASITASQLGTSSFSFDVPVNLQINASVAANLLTVAIKGNNGNDPSPGNPVYVPFRDTTLTAGGPVWVTISTALSINTFATGATLGSTNTNPFRFWIVLFNNGGTAVPALINASTQSSTAVTIFPVNEHTLQSTTQISGSATLAGVFYTPNGTTLTAKAFRIIGYLEYSTGLTTAGTYNNGPTLIQLFGPGSKKPGDVVQKTAATFTASQTATSATKATTTTLVSLTPTSVVNPVRVHAVGFLAAPGNNNSTTNAHAQLNRSAAACSVTFNGVGNTVDIQITNSGIGASAGPVTMTAFDNPQTTSSTTYEVCIWSSAATTTWLGTVDSIVQQSYIEAEEIQG